MECCSQDLFNIYIARSIFVQFQSSFLSTSFVSIYLVHLYSRIDTTATWKKLRFISLDWSDFLMIDNLSIAVHAFDSRTFSVVETPLLWLVNLSTSFSGPSFSVEILLFD